MAILVTGAAGFIGSHLAEELVNQGNEVIGLDNLLTGNIKNIKPFENKIKFIKGDIRDKEILNDILDDVEQVYHLAAQISVVKSVMDPQTDADINIKGFLNLLEVIRKKDVKKIVFFSTGGAIYGEPDPKELPVPETTIERPLSPYGMSKLAGERYLQWYHKEYGLSFSIIRPANVFGPRQDPRGEAGVISIFLGRIYNEQPITVFGDGKDTRDYVYVKDVISASIKAMKSNYNEAFNVGTGIETSVLDIIDTISKVTNKNNIQVIFDKPRPGDVHRIALDANKAKKLLSWEPKVSLQSGMEKVWEWFKNSKKH